MKRHSIRRRTIGLLSVAVVALATAGCAAGGDSGDSEDVLHVVMWKGGGSEIANVPEINAKFEEAHPGVTVDFTFVKRQDYDTYNNTRFNGGNAADVLMVDSGLTTQWADAGFLANLSDEPWVPTVADDVVPFTQVDGETYQFVQEVIPVGLFVNNDLLASVGIDEAPADWESFIDALEVLRDAGVNGLLAGNKGGWSGSNLIQLSSVNSVLQDNPQWNDDFNAKKADFNPDWETPLAQLQELLSTGLVDGTTMLGIDPWGDALTEFKTGEWAFMAQGAWMISDFAANTDFSFSIVPYPSNESGQPVGFKFVGSGLAVNEKSKVPDLAREYVDFWAQDENLQPYLVAESAFSPLTDGNSPLPEQAGAFITAQEEGRVLISPSQFWRMPAGADPFGEVGEQLFVDPSTDLSRLLDSLDSSIGAERQ